LTELKVCCCKLSRNQRWKDSVSWIRLAHICLHKGGTVKSSKNILRGSMQLRSWYLQTIAYGWNAKGL